MSWPVVEFGEVATIVTGSTPKKVEGNYDGDIPFVTPGDLGIHAEINYSNSMVTEQGAKSGRLLPKGAVLVCCIGATIGKVGIADCELITNQQINSLVFDESKVFPKFGYYFCTSIKPLLIARSSSTTMPIVNKSNFSKFEMPLPPLEEQKRIAAILDKADSVRRKRQQAIDLADYFLRSVFIDMFGDPVANPKGWETGSFSDISEINPKAEKYDDDLSVSFVPMPSVSESSHKLDASDIRSYSEVKKGFTAFKENDVLFAKITPCMENGKAAIAHNLFNGIGFGSTEFHVFRPKNIHYSIFIYSLIHLPLFRKIAASNFSGAVGHKRVPKDFLASFKLILPPENLIKKFGDIFEKVNVSKEKFNNCGTFGTELFNSLSQKAFEGEL